MEVDKPSVVERKPSKEYKSSSQLCAEWDISNINVHYTNNDFTLLNSYKLYSQHIRPIIAAKHPKLSKSKVMALIAAKWKEFCEIKDKGLNAEPEIPNQLANERPDEEVNNEEVSDAIDDSEEKANEPGRTSAEESEEDLNVEDIPVSKLRKKPRRSGPSKSTRSGSKDNRTVSQRRSARQSRPKRHTILNDDSDEEFEAMLRIEEGRTSDTESVAALTVVRKKARKSKEATAPRPPINRLNRPIPSTPSADDGNDTDHQDYCDVCGQGGEILLCDGCPRAFHLVCVDPEADSTPEGDWFCPICVRDGVTVDNQKANTELVSDNHMEYCRVCKDGGELLCCDQCPNSYHMNCIVPNVTEIPEGEWICPRCLIRPPKVQVKRVLTWRWRSVDDIDYGYKVEAFCTKLLLPTDDKHRVRELFVKYDGLSYWHCEWLPELVLEVHQTTLWRCFWKKHMDHDTPPHEIIGNDYDNLPTRNCEQDTDLENRYLKYGIRIEWLTVHRIINHRKERDGDLYYLVKWRDLSYDQATFEPEADDFASEIRNWQRHIDDYWKVKKRSQSISGKASSKASSTAGKESARIDPRKKFERQPEYIDAVGGTLHEYQLEGLNWLRFSWAQNTDVILADEMGLGKTVQTISFLYSLYKENLCEGPFLISAPLSTIINWDREFDFWAPDMYVVTYTGDRECRSMIRKHEFCIEDDGFRTVNRACKLRAGARVKFNVLLTSYELISVDAACLSSVDWEVLVVDEAHRLKNNQSKFFRTLSEFSIRHKLLLTGTPLQNNLEELYHLLNFLSSENFNDMTGFLSEFSDISKDNQVKKLHDMLGPHLLRRLKADVLSNMPSKSEFIVRVEPSLMQKKYYQYIIHRNYEILTMKAGGAQPSLLNVVMELKKCCNHPYLLTSAAMDAPITKNGQYEGTTLIKACGKLELLYKMLPKLQNTQHRVLIFSQMTRMMDILEDFLDFMGYKFERIDGKITGQERQDAIDRFNAPGAEQFVFLLSTRSGGLGINLATADTVIIYDSDWNPHNDIQAFSRAHRIGQTNKVMIYRFVTRDSVEERICQVAKRKMMLTHLIVRPGVGRGGQNMSKKELEDILKFGTESLFKTNEKGDIDEDDKCMIHYDDKAIDRLLDRSQQGIEEKECSLNEYLSSFKVASYLVRDDFEEEIVEKEEEYDNAYWEKLIGNQHSQFVEDESNNWGKGKRSRRQVNYAVPANEDSWHDQMSDGNSEHSKLSQNEDEEEYTDFDEKIEGRRKRGAKEKVLPPLLTKINGVVEVLGFNTRQRKAFLNAVMRFGLPPKDIYNSQWLVRDLRQKTERELKAYTSLFMRHMCEPMNIGTTECFMDGVPREGLSRQQILSRIGILSLIRKKVNEYQDLNPLSSLPELQTEEIKAVSRLAEIAPTVDCCESKPSESVHIDIKEEVEKSVANVDYKINVIFNIADGGFTELHCQWSGEDREIASSVNPSTLQRELWNRAHDYWLLVGIVTHGHSRWQDIQSDSRFALINEPFKRNSDKGNYLELKNKFLARRYKLLEQALVVEEQLRRACFLIERNKFATNADATLNLLNRYTELETIAECHKPLTSESVTTSPDYKLSNLVVQKVLCQLDEILIEMKNEINKLPSAMSRIEPVSERLCMSEQSILSSLVNQISKAANKTISDNKELDTNKTDSNIKVEETPVEMKQQPEEVIPNDINCPNVAANLNPYFTYPIEVGKFSFPVSINLPAQNQQHQEVDPSEIVILD